uniref:Uncharacterized protein n=1 Tax=Oryza nivara TaxID=4536 RepID=A0A0E0GZ18_ORYNI
MASDLGRSTASGRRMSALTISKHESEINGCTGPSMVMPPLTSMFAPTVCNPHTPVVAEFKPVIVSGLDLHDILVVANSADAITGVSDFDLKIVIAAGAVAVLLAMFPCS